MSLPGQEKGRKKHVQSEWSAPSWVSCGSDIVLFPLKAEQCGSIPVSPFWPLLCMDQVSNPGVTKPQAISHLTHQPEMAKGLPGAILIPRASQPAAEVQTEDQGHEKHSKCLRFGHFCKRLLFQWPGNTSFFLCWKMTSWVVSCHGCSTRFIADFVCYCAGLHPQRSPGLMNSEETGPVFLRSQKQNCR